MRLAKLMKYARTPLELNGEPGYEVAVIADTNTDPLIYEALTAAAYELDMEPHLVMALPRSMHGNEPTRVVAEAMRAADLSLCPASTAMTHTDAVRAVVRAGHKFVSMPGVTVDMLTNGAATVDPKDLQRVTGRVAEVISGGRQVRVTCARGTDVTFSLEGRIAFPLDGVVRPGRMAGWPTGEAATAPVEGTAEGTIVFDTSMHALGLLKEPIRLTVRGGQAVAIEGGAQAKQLIDILETRGDANSRNIGEFAIGTNSKARIVGNVSEDKKQIGTVHFALGDNATLGGTVSCKTHLDGVISRPTVIVDGVVLVDAGRVVL